MTTTIKILSINLAGPASSRGSDGWQQAEQPGENTSKLVSGKYKGKLDEDDILKFRTFIWGYCPLTFKNSSNNNWLMEKLQPIMAGI